MRFAFAVVDQRGDAAERVDLAEGRAVLVAGVDVDDIPVSTRIVTECERLPAFAAAAPALQVGAPAL